MMQDLTRIEAHLKLLTNFAFQGATHFRIWKRLLIGNGILTADEELGKKLAPVFIHMSQKAHYDSAFMHLARLLDNHGDATSIMHFLRCIESNPKIFSSHKPKKILTSVKEDQKALEKFKDVIESVEGRRNEFYAHIDRSLITDTQSAFKEYPLTASDLETAYELIGKILNRYSGYLDNSSTWMGIAGEEDVTKLLRYVGAKLRRNKKERRERRHTSLTT